jgi:Transposase DDE domain
VRAFGLRQTRYQGLEKTHLQHVAIAAAINIDRIVAWLDERPRAKTRTSRFAALAPACALPSGTPPEKTAADLPGPVTASKSKL